MLASNNGMSLYSRVKCLHLAIYHYGIFGGEMLATLTFGAYDIIDGEVSALSLAVSAIIGDAVTFFFVITGCFLFLSGKSFRKVIKKYLLSVLLPSVLFALVFQVFREYLVSDKVSLDGTKLHLPQLELLLRGLLERNPGIWHEACGVYWYIIDYGLALLWYPILILFCNKEYDRVAKGLIIFTVGNLALGEIQLLFQLPGIYVNQYYLLPITVVEMVLGYVLYTNRMEFRKKKLAPFLGSALFAVGVGLRFCLQYKLYYINPMDLTFLYWNHSLAFLNAIGIFVFVFSMNWSNITINFIVTRIAPKTFYIYLVHQAIIIKLRAIGVFDKLWIYCRDNLIGGVAEICYDLFAFVLVVVISYLIVSVITEGKKIRKTMKSIIEKYS